MTESWEVIKYIGHRVTVYNNRLYINGILRSAEKNTKYRVDSDNHSGYYIFEEKEIKRIDLTTLVIMIEVE